MNWEFTLSAFIIYDLLEIKTASLSFFKYVYELSDLSRSWLEATGSVMAKQNTVDWEVSKNTKVTPVDF